MNFFQHDVTDAEADAMAQAVKDGHITTGVKLKEFATALEKTFGFRNVNLCSSGTAALHLALYALGIGPGDEVITTPYVGVWTANTILMVGATPVFADIDRRTYNLDPKAVAEKVTGRTKAVIPVSVNGVPCDYWGIRKMIPDDVRIVCDDIEALGSRRQGVFVGADVGMDVSINGFWVSKQVTSAGGGMIATGDAELSAKWEKLTRHGHGLVGDMWEQHFGFNYWLSDPQAALGHAQLTRIWQKQDRLRKIASLMDQYFWDQIGQSCLPGDRKTEFVYIIELPKGVDKKAYADAMAKHGIPTRPYFNSLLDVPHLKQYASECEVAEQVAKRTIALPFHWKMEPEDAADIFRAHQKVIHESPVS